MLNHTLLLCKWLHVLFTMLIWIVHSIQYGCTDQRHIRCQVEVRGSVYMYIWSQFSTNCFKFLLLWPISSCNQISFPQKIFTNFTLKLVKHGFLTVQSSFTTILKWFFNYVACFGFWQCFAKQAQSGATSTTAGWLSAYIVMYMVRSAPRCLLISDT